MSQSKLEPSVLFERMVARLRLRHLKLLVAVDQCGTFASAAAEVGMSQPAATQMIKELEGLLEVQLYERHSRGVNQTEVGRLLAEHSRTVLVNLQHAANSVSASAQSKQAPLHIGAVPAAIFRMIEPNIGSLRTTLLAPLIVFEAEPDRLLASLNGGTIEAALLRQPAQPPVRKFTFTPVCEDSLAIVSSPALKWHPGPTALRELSKFNWSAPPPTSSSGTAFDQACREAGFFPQRSQIQSVAQGLLCKVVEDAKTLAAVPRSLATALIKEGKLREIRLESAVPLPPLGAMHLTDRPSPSCRKLLAILTERAA